MTEPIQPALTPEEWAAVALADAGKLLPLPRRINGPFKQVVKEHPVRRHALAAFALHGQPFGFTRDDVEMLRAEAELNRERRQRLTGQFIDELADRIEALLPPRDQA